MTQPRPQGLLAFQYGGGLGEDPGGRPGVNLVPRVFSLFKMAAGSGEDPGTQQITCLQRGWRCIQNGGYGEKGEKNWVRDAKVKINKMAISYPESTGFLVSGRAPVETLG